MFYSLKFKPASLFVQLAVLPVVFFLFSCQDEHHRSADAVAETTVSSINTGEDDKGRLTIKTASIQAKVNDVNESIEVLNQKALAMNGKLEKISIHETLLQTHRVHFSKDSDKVIDKVIPEASLKLSVPKKYTDTFINFVLKSGYTIKNFDYENKDYFVKSDALAKQEQNNVDAALAYENDLAYQSKYLWFDISLEGQVKTSAAIVLRDDEMRQPFGLSGLFALQKGWYFIQDLVLFLVAIWPVYFIALAIYFIVKKLKQTQVLKLPKS